MPKGKTKTRLRDAYGAIFTRLTKRGLLRWCGDFRGADGERKRKVFPFAQTEEDAWIALHEEIRREFEREYSIKRAPKKARFNQLKSVYLTNHAIPRKRSWRSDEKYLNSQLVPFFGEMGLSEITPLHVRQFIVKRQNDGVRNSTINRELTVLKKMLNLAMEWGFDLEKNPVTKESFFSEGEFRRDRVLTYREEESLFHYAAQHLRAILTCALLTGMRLSEILGLKWANVDLERRQIVIRAGSSKSRKQRIIPICDTLYFELRKLRKLGCGTGDFVFLYEDPKTGKLRPVKTIRHAFENACRRAGIKNFHFHDLRHTAGTRLIENGADPITVMEIMGHANLSTTQIYLHSSMKRMEEAVKLLDRNEDEKRGDLALPGRIYGAQNKVSLVRYFFSNN